MRVALSLILLSTALTCQAQKVATLTTRLTARFGFPDGATSELMVQVLHVEKHQLEINDPRLAGRVFHLKSQEFRDGVAQPEQDLLGQNRDRLRLDAKGHFACNVYARPATDARLEVKFFFPTMGKEQQFAPLPSAKATDYSLRTDILA
ncbi:hypothetical protein FY528_13080 [Hymenobacter lutimineralis]|uniref:Uncharacterized protein n=1 Tax=Hymenobacter lutimineralis TaxID=2606448 RepID=A0A5D6UZH4_9BACT|nr:hypothetical protein [Hymenobacter lutimineralis]TYZ08377.1 hypothetical protein FY528_13080 [Hymenobacter lutimineralis]